MKLIHIQICFRTQKVPFLLHIDRIAAEKGSLPFNPVNMPQGPTVYMIEFPSDSAMSPLTGRGIVAQVIKSISFDAPFVIVHRLVEGLISFSRAHQRAIHKQAGPVVQQFFGQPGKLRNQVRIKQQ